MHTTSSRDGTITILFCVLVALCEGIDLQASGVAAFGRIGAIVGPKLGGTLKAAAHTPSQLLMDLLPIVIIGSLCALWLAWEVRRNDPSAEAF
jgi:hypothetical protein